MVDMEGWSETIQVPRLVIQFKNKYGLQAASLQPRSRYSVVFGGLWKEAPYPQDERKMILQKSKPQQQRL
jgi:hypothetical protein